MKPTSQPVINCQPKSNNYNLSKESFSNIINEKRELEFENIKHSNDFIISSLNERNQDILRDIEKTIYYFFNEVGIHILISKSDIHADQIIIRIVPHSGIRVSTVLSFKNDLSLR